MSENLTISVSFKIEPTCASMILTVFLPEFSILCTAPKGINIESFSFLKNYSCLM